MGTGAEALHFSGDGVVAGAHEGNIKLAAVVGFGFARILGALVDDGDTGAGNDGSAGIRCNADDGAAGYLGGGNGTRDE